MTDDRIEDGELLFGDLASCHAALKRYGRELDAAAEALAKFHPIGMARGIGRLEVAQAAEDLVDVAATTSDPDDDTQRN